MNQYMFETYAEALNGAGPKLKELILDRAAHDDSITLKDLRQLCRVAYPEEA